MFLREGRGPRARFGEDPWDWAEAGVSAEEDDDWFAFGAIEALLVSLAVFGLAEAV